jgi:hypothetical protein
MQSRVLATVIAALVMLGAISFSLDTGVPEEGANDQLLERGPGCIKDCG